MTDATPQKPAADWYPDPSGSGQLRFWDGEQWTQQLRAQEQSTTLPGDTVNLDTSNFGAGFAGVQSGGQFHGQTAGQPLPQQHAHSAQAGFFRSLFDLSFAAERSVTTSFVKVIYVLGVALSALSWLGTALLFFILGGIENAAYSAFGSDGGGSLMVFGVLVLIFGWIPGFINVIFLRIGLEFVTAQIRTSQHTAELVRQARAAA